jgi:hypothetical protein
MGYAPKESVEINMEPKTNEKPVPDQLKPIDPPKPINPIQPINPIPRDDVQQKWAEFPEKDIPI